MKWIMLAFSLCLALDVHADEKATYVGEGRYYSPSDSVDSAVLRQRTHEQTQRQEERRENDRRNDREDRRDREYQYEKESSRY